MKKALVPLLILAAAGGLFAQELKFDGYLNSGLGFLSSDEEDADSALRAFGVDSEQWGYRFRLNGSFTGEKGNAGVKFRFQSQSRVDAGYFSIPYAYGWVSLLNSLITVTGGLVDDGVWNSGGGILDDDVGEGLGALVKISPVGGLDLGTGAYVLGYNSGGNNNVLLAADFSKVSVKPWHAKYTFNAGYAMPDLFKITAVLRLKNEVSYDEIQAPAVDPNAGRDESAKTIVAARLLAVPNLTAVVEGELDKLEHFNSAGLLNLYETVGYKIGGLAMGLNAVQYFSQAEETDIGLRFNPWVSYTIKSVVPRLDFVYFMAGVPDTQGKYHRKNYKTNYNDDFSILTVRPSVKFNFDSKTFVEIGDLVSLEKGPENSFAGKSSRLTNAFYVDFKWSF
jgi:hypothetical protein